MKALSIFLKAVLSIAFLTVATLSIFVWFYRDIPQDVLFAKYGDETSKFLNIDGVRVHYKINGPEEAPAVVLLHAHWASLIMWEDWVRELEGRYKVIRFDMAGHGLTGVDETGDYTLERGVRLMELLFDQLALEEFDLIGTSLGGTHAIHYTVKNPDRVNRLVLLNPGALNAGVRGRSAARALPWWIDILTVITPKSFFQFMLEGGFGNPESVPDSIVTRWHELQLNDGQRPAELSRTRQYVSGDIVSLIKSITVPTFVMWGRENPVVTVDQAYEFISLLESAPDRQLAIYPGLGHMAVLEDGTKTARDIRAYLDGNRKFDDHKREM